MFLHSGLVLSSAGGRGEYMKFAGGSMPSETFKQMFRSDCFKNLNEPEGRQYPAGGRL